MTTHKIDPALVREVLGIGDYNCSIQVFDENIKLYSENDSIPDEDMFSFIKGVVHDYDLGGGFLDIHRFKDKAIEYLAGKGWVISISRHENRGLVTVSDKEFANPPELFWSGKDKDYSNMLSAELAAISFVWEQIQKEEGKC